MVSINAEPIAPAEAASNAAFDEFDDSLTVETIYDRLIVKSHPENSGCGKYQWLMFIAIACGITSPGYIVFNLGFLELMPQFNCRIDGIWVSDCSREQIC